MIVPYFKNIYSYYAWHDSVKDDHLSYYTSWRLPHGKIVYGQKTLLNLDNYVEYYSTSLSL